MSGFKRPDPATRPAVADLPALKARPKPTSADQIAAIDAASAEMGFTVRAEPALPAKPKRGAPVRVTRENPRRVSIELDGDTYRRLQLLGVARGEKLQAMGERAILDYLEKCENK